MNLVQTAVALTALTLLTVTPVLAFQPGGVQIKGNNKQTVTARTVTNVAAGAKTIACQEIATIGDNPACR